MRHIKDERYKYAIHAGYGRAYVDGPTRKLFLAGFVGWAVGFVPGLIVASAILPEGSSIILPVAAAFSFFGWMVGLLIGAVKYRSEIRNLERVK